MMLAKLYTWALSANIILAAGLFGQFSNVPQEARDASRSGLTTPIVNGLNFQSRIDVRLTEIADAEHSRKHVVAVNRDFSFEVLELPAGEYELSIHAYDFMVQTPRYRILVGDYGTKAYIDGLASSSFNTSSEQMITRSSPLMVEITGFKSFYENPEGRLTEVLMNSPFGFIFRSKLYSLLFFASLVIMAFPYVIPYLSPDFAEQYQKLQAEMNSPSQEETKNVSILPPKPDVGKQRARLRRGR